MIQHYFLGAWIPATDDAQSLLHACALDGGRYVLGMVGPTCPCRTAPPRLFATHPVRGPKLQEQMKRRGPGLELTVDYGVLTVLAQAALLAAGQWIHDLVGNWGWAIVLLTILIKLAFYKLSETSYRPWRRCASSHRACRR
jgi:YidC/Oxa1 family membrane protein insertase